MKYVDNYGNEFKTKEEVKAYAVRELYNEDYSDFVDTLNYYVTCDDILDWIFKTPTIFEKFKEDYAGVIRAAEHDYANSYFYNNCEEIED